MRTLLDSIVTAKDALLRNEAVKSQIGVEITLVDSTRIYWGTADFALQTIAVNGEVTNYGKNFVSKLRQVPEIRFSLTSVTDGGRFTFENLDYAISQTLGSEGYAYAGAAVKVFYCLWTGSAYDGELIFVGKLRDATGNSTVAEFGCISDLADVKALVANRELTQKCLAVLGDNRCGLSGIGPGDHCTKVFDDAVGGCLFWGNQARFWGVPFLTAERLGVGTVGSGSGWEPGGTGFCCDPAHFVRTPHGYAVLGDLKAGDVIIDHTGKCSLITKSERTLAPRRYVLRTNNGLSIICSPQHPVFARVQEGERWRELGKTSLTSLRPEQTMEILTHNGRHQEWTGYALGVSNAGPVVKLSLEHPNWYLVNATPDNGGIVSHNNKPIFWETSVI